MITAYPMILLSETGAGASEALALDRGFLSSINTTFSFRCQTV